MNPELARVFAFNRPSRKTKATTLGGPITIIAPEEATQMEAGRDTASEGHGANRTWDMWKDEAMSRWAMPHLNSVRFAAGDLLRCVPRSFNVPERLVYELKNIALGRMLGAQGIAP